MSDGILEGAGQDIGRTEGDHTPETFLRNEVDGSSPEPSWPGRLT
jgi:hypothetical protein